MRFGIIYSDRISSGSAVEALTNSVLNSKEVKIGSKLNSRRFVHIDDIVNGIYLSYKKKIQGTFNLAGDKDINLGEIINLSKKILNKNVTIVESKKTKPSIRKVSNLQAKTKLGWRPKISIYEGIQKIIKRKI